MNNWPQEPTHLAYITPQQVCDAFVQRNLIPAPGHTNVHSNRECCGLGALFIHGSDGSLFEEEHGFVNVKEDKANIIANDYGLSAWASGFDDSFKISGYSGFRDAKMWKAGYQAGQHCQKHFSLLRRLARKIGIRC